MLIRDTWKQRIQERPDRPQGRQHRQLAALLALADLLDAKTGEGRVSLLDLAKASGASERTVKRAIVWARTVGVLEQTSRGHRLGDGTAAASAWQLLVASEPQQVKPPSQGASPSPQEANSQPQSANSAKAPKSRSTSKRTGKRGTHMPPPSSEILRPRDWCRDCGFELDRALAGAGIQVHVGCVDPVADPPTPSSSITTRR